MGKRWWAPAGLAAVALVAAACGSSGSSSTSGSGSSGGGSSPSAAAGGSGSSSSMVKSTTISGVKVLTNAKGFTLYWFVPDTSTKSNCNGACAQYWPPVKGPVTAATGVTGKIGVITRQDGSKQATYGGHPLYTYVSDTAPGQAKGNGVNLSGGVWHEMTVTGATAAAATTKSSSGTGSGGGGYGY
jgi:predicted lipoprotein with Yx(FWY)xxD motif